MSATGKRVFEVTVETVEHRQPADPSFVVVQALPKGDRGELAVEVLTEIGVDRIVPWAASRVGGGLEGRAGHEVAGQVALHRPRGGQAVTTRRGSRRSPSWPRPTDVCALVAAAELAVVLHEEAATGLAGVPLPGRGGVLVVVGPEGGFTDDEVAAFVAAGARSARLGDEVLRTSTAGVAAVAALLARTPRWR